MHPRRPGQTHTKLVPINEHFSQSVAVVVDERLRNRSAQKLLHADGPGLGACLFPEKDEAGTGKPAKGLGQLTFHRFVKQLGEGGLQAVWCRAPGGKRFPEVLGARPRRAWRGHRCEADAAERG